MRLQWLTIVLLAWAAATGAQTSIIYSRSQLVIEPAHEQVLTAPAKDDEKKTDQAERENIKKIARINHLFMVNVLASRMLNAEGLYQQDTLQPTEGVLFVYPEERTVTLDSANIYTPRDVLLIAKDGTVVQIIPNLIFAEMQEPITSPAPILALLLLSPGTAQALDIRPKDRALHETFQKKPVILE